ncbi:6041_t:CDS:1 [Acaulospora colombiana]|uniref:6041_t:CDS:1 n=1 Tax=Acaulospora colombiana TaxID=27376 RepID=A0ACA9P4P8_9GLOM|nr:6041_t:CDS:1 [Acaulospora colombiana]
MKHYTRLLERRIDWTQPARKRDTEGEDDEGSENEKSAQNPVESSAMATDEASLADNRCDTVWQGVISERVLHGFKTVRAPTDNIARENLGSKLSPYWDTVKNWRPADEELYE